MIMIMFRSIYPTCETQQQQQTLLTNAQVEHEDNLTFLLAYLASFCEKLPSEMECQDQWV